MSLYMNLSLKSVGSESESESGSQSESVGSEFGSDHVDLDDLNLSHCI